MTLLNWCLEDGGAYILTDTLMTVKGERSGPMALSTKVYPHQRLKLLVVGTGSHHLVRRFDDYVSSLTLAETIEELADEAKPILMALFDEAVSSGFQGTATVYLFGYSPTSARVVGYRFASGESFAPDPIPAGFSIKPPLFDMTPLEERIPFNGLDDLCFAAQLQHAEDAERRAAGGLDIQAMDEGGACGIGGELIAHWIQTGDDGLVRLSSETVMRIPGYEEDLAACEAGGLAGVEPHLREIYRRRVVDIVGDAAGRAAWARWPIFEEETDDAQ